MDDDENVIEVGFDRFGGNRGITILEDDDNDVVSNVALLLQLLFVSLCVRQKCRYVEHDVIVAELGEVGVLASLTMVDVQTSGVSRPVLQLNLLRNGRHEPVKRFAALLVTQKLVISSLSSGGKDHAKLVVFRDQFQLHVHNRFLGQVGFLELDLLPIKGHGRLARNEGIEKRVTLRELSLRVHRRDLGYDVSNPGSYECAVRT